MMMNGDAEIESKEAAVREVAKLLPLPENLQSIAALRADFAQRQQANDAQLSTSVITQVEQAKNGMDTLNASQTTILELREAFALIDKLCTECKNLIAHHDQINKLSIARNNLNATIKDAEGMMSIAQEAAAARNSLFNERELVRTFEKLTALEGKRRFALAAVSARKNEQSKLTEYFEDVNETRQQFEAKLWRHARNFFITAKETPHTLVRVVRVIEMQEALDNSIEDEVAEAEKLAAAGERRRSSYTTSADISNKRGYKTRLFQELTQGVEEHFRKLNEELVYGDLKEALDEASQIASELPDIYDYVAPCFPPRYDIFLTMVQLYTNHFSTTLRRIGDRAKDLGNPEILDVMKWIARFQEQLLALGVEESQAEILAECGAMDPLMNAYVDRMQESTQTWYKNILEADKVKPAKFTDEGRAYTPAAVDLFRILNEQVAPVQGNCSAVMIFRVAQAIIVLMNEFQGAERKRMEDPVMDIGLEHLCALVNNNVRCYDASKELSDNISQNLTQYYLDQIHFEDTCRGFLEIAKEAVYLTVEFIFVDPGVQKIIADLYGKDWGTGLTTETLIETFRDYFNDIEKYIEERSFRRFAEACLERAVICFIDALLLQKNYIKDDTLDRMQKDEIALAEFFAQYINDKKVEKRIQPLVDLRDLVMSDSVETFELNYTTLLQAHPDCPPEVVEKLIKCREDVSRSDKNEVIQLTKDLWQAAIEKNNGELPKPGPVFSRLTAIAKPTLELKRGFFG